jgi:hypothetical protein
MLALGSRTTVNLVRHRCRHGCRQATSRLRTHND